MVFLILFFLLGGVRSISDMPAREAAIVPIMSHAIRVWQ
jgi:hypothetical protein